MLQVAKYVVGAAVLLGLGVVLAQNPTPTSTFTDPQGHFSVKVPTDWKTESRQGFGLLSSPDGGIKVYVLSLEGTDVDSTIPNAWKTVDPGFNLEVTQSVSPPVPAGIEAFKSFIYKTAPDRVVQGAGRLFKGRVYFLLFDGKLASLQARGSQLMIIDGSLEIKGLSKVNLKGQKAKAWTPGLQAELEAFVQQSLKRSGVPGVSVSVVQNGKVVYAKGFGVREAGKNDPVTPETLMMIGSTGKTMTTLLMAQLVDEGRLTWDTPVVKLMPQFRVADPALTNTLTVQNLVCACTGAPRRDLELLFKASKWTAERTIESLKDIRFYTKVGEAFHYSNQMVATGGYVAAMADGAKYGNLLEGYIQSVDRRIFKPLGMTSTTLRMNQALSRPNRAVPHGLFLDASYRPISTEAERFVMPVAPAGAPWSNAVDMGRYLIAELSVGVGSDGKRIVSEKNLRQTWTPQVPMSAETSYGLGWFVSNYKGLPMLSHGGNTMGFTSDLAFLPGEGVGISVLSNGRGTNALNQAIRTRLFELLYGVAAEAQTELEHSLETVKGSFEALGKQIKTVDAAALRAYLGAYNSSSLGSAVLSVNDGKLVLDAGEVVLELGSIGDGRFVVTNPPLLGQGVTLEQRDGRFNIVIGEGRDAYTFTKR